MKGTVLVVDDSAMMRKVVLRVLKMADVEFEAVLEAGDGNEALTLLRTTRLRSSCATSICRSCPAWSY